MGRVIQITLFTCSTAIYIPYVAMNEGSCQQAGVGGVRAPNR